MIDEILRLAVLVLALVWIILPFAVFGIKKRLNALIEAQGRLQYEMAKLRRDLKVMVEDSQKSTVD